jgi:hypothetical protein
VVTEFMVRCDTDQLKESAQQPHTFSVAAEFMVAAVRSVKRHPGRIHGGSSDDNREELMVVAVSEMASREESNVSISMVARESA